MNWGLPPDWSTRGHEIDTLIVFMHWVMLALAVFWAGYMTLALWRFRAGAEVDRQAPRGRWALALAGALLVLEISLLVAFEVPRWAARQRAPAHGDSFVVRVTAEQFAWNFHYPGKDGVFGPTAADRIDAYNPVGLDLDHPDAGDDLVTINQLHVPMGRRILLELGSKDVIHGFYLPYFRVKQDVLPGRLTPVWFEPTRMGTSEIGCAQLCGLGHYRMRGQITVQSEAEFAAWYEDELAFM